MIQACNCDFTESVKSGTDCVVVACTQVNSLGEVCTEGDGGGGGGGGRKKNKAQSAHAQSVNKGVNQRPKDVTQIQQQRAESPTVTHLACV